MQVAKITLQYGTISTVQLPTELRAYKPTHRPFHVPVWLQVRPVHHETNHVFVTSRRQLRAYIDIYGKSSPLTRIRNIIAYIWARLPNPIAESSGFCANVRATITDLSHIRTRPPPATPCIIFLSLIIISAQRNHCVVS